MSITNEFSQKRVIIFIQASRLHWISLTHFVIFSIFVRYQYQVNASDGLAKHSCIYVAVLHRFVELKRAYVHENKSVTILWRIMWRVYALSALCVTQSRYLCTSTQSSARNFTYCSARSPQLTTWRSKFNNFVFWRSFEHKISLHSLNFDFGWYIRNASSRFNHY